MTLGEIRRKIDSVRRVKQQELKIKAQFDYILSDTIGRSISRMYDGKMPPIYEVYPSLFNEEDYKEQNEKRKNELSEIRFRQFAANFNKRFFEKEAKEKQ